MLSRIPKATYLLTGILWSVSVIIFAYGCREERNKAAVTDAAARPAVMMLNMANGTTARAKAITLTITAVDDNGQAVSQTFDHPQFPVNTEFELTVPPCHYTITATATLSGGDVTSANAEVDACTFAGETVMLSITTYEPFYLNGPLIDAPSPVQAGLTITVTCTGNVTAPDIDLYPIRVELRESGGSGVSGVFTYSGEVMSGAFADPYPAVYGSSPSRTFTCRLSDERGTAQTETHTIARITPTPSPTPSPVPTATPITYTLTVSIIGTGIVVSDVGGMTCPGVCSASYAPGTIVNLYVSSGTFFSWAGSCTGTSVCTIMMNASQSVTAQFSP